MDGWKDFDPYKSQMSWPPFQDGCRLGIDGITMSAYRPCAALAEGSEEEAAAAAAV